MTSNQHIHMMYYCTLVMSGKTPVMLVIDQNRQWSLSEMRMMSWASMQVCD